MVIPRVGQIFKIKLLLSLRSIRVRLTVATSFRNRSFKVHEMNESCPSFCGDNTPVINDLTSLAFDKHEKNV